jgi:hypothetical protein
MCDLKFKFSCLAMAGLLLCNTALAWDKLGHETVARIAAMRLTPAAAKAVSKILKGQSLADIASWADEYRDELGHSETAAWHYINLDVRQPLTVSDWLRYCHPQSCVVAQIGADLAVLSDSKLRRPLQEQFALKFLVHFMGDMHQPLHVADAGDRGASSKLVQLPGVAPAEQPKSLHYLWNDPEYFEGQTSAAALAEKLNGRITQAQAAQWAQGGAADWAFESYQIGKTLIYPDFEQAPRDGAQAKLSADYIQRMRPVVEQRLQQAGVRLAWLLNTLFSG